MTEPLHLHTYEATWYSNGGPLQQEAEAFFTLCQDLDAHQPFVTYVFTVGGGELLSGVLTKDQMIATHRWLMAWEGRTVTSSSPLPMSVDASFVVEAGEYRADFTHGMDELREWLEEVLA